jgi:hypothetical protein
MIFVKKSPLNNFLTVRPIFTINIPIDSAYQAEKRGKIKRVPNSTLVEQPGISLLENTPKTTF